MLFATLGMSIFNIALWCVPNSINNVLKLIWIVVSLLLLETFNTMFATPYSALGNELAKNYNDRTKINSCNIIFYLIGIIIPSILMIIFLPNTEEYPIGQLNPKGYVNIAFVTSFICLFFGIICSLFARNKDEAESKITRKKKFNINVFLKSFSKSFRHKKLRKLILGYVFTSSVTVFLCSVGLHFFTYSFFYTSKQITMLLITLLIGTMVSQSLWINLSKKLQKKPALILGILITIFSTFGIISIYFFRVELYKISFYIMLFLIFACGVGSGALYTLPVSMYGDVIQYINSGKTNQNASYLGTLTFASNIANSICQLVVGVMLDVIKFDSSLKVQSLKVQTGLALILFIGVQASLILGCLVFSGYKERIIEK